MRPHHVLFLGLLIALSGCPAPTPAWQTDADGDGYFVDEDCDDGRADVHPGADERCNGVDDDCDGVVDEDDAVDALPWYQDQDGDGYGAGEPSLACAAPAGWVIAGGDCDDQDTSAFPGAPEFCDGIDNDCDGAVDEDGAQDERAWYPDADGDGYGDESAVPRMDCAPPAGFVENALDCDDRDVAIHPGADEHCDGADDDCDGMIDEDDAVDAPAWYQDADGDGFGDPLVSVVQCAAPSGHVADDTDCDDTAADVHPGADEYCNTVDDDCDGAVDEPGAVDAPTWYRDSDGDGYGDPSTAVDLCTAPTRYVADNTDCDDRWSARHPGADEYCNGVDDDCDGVADEGDAVDALSAFADLDGDGYGDAASPVRTCTLDAGSVLDATDCDDSDPGVNPAATEACDSVDDDCDGMIDEDWPEVGTACGSCGAYVCSETGAGTFCDLRGVTNDCGTCGAADVGVGAACGTCGRMTCDGCDDPGLNACGTCGPLPAEICDDGIDQDCDGADDACAEPDFGPGWVDGTVFDADTLTPLVGAAVAWDDSTEHYVATDADGRFAFPFSESQDSVLLTVTHDGYTFAQRRAEVPAGTDVAVDPIYLRALDGNVVTVTPYGGDLTNAAGNIRIFVPEGAVTEPAQISGTWYEGSRELPGPLPETSHFTYAVDLRGDANGTNPTGEEVTAAFAVPVTFEIANTRGFAAGTAVPMGWYDPEAGEWEHAGMGEVNADGDWIRFETSHFSPYDLNFPVVAVASGAGAPDDGNTGDGTPHDKDPCAGQDSGNSEVCFHDGSLGITHELPSYQSLGRTRGLSLTYNSGAAYPSAILSAQTTIDLGEVDMPNVVSMVGTIGGTRLESWFTPMEGTQALQYQWDGVNARSEAVASGAYRYTATVSFGYETEYWSATSFGGDPVAPLGIVADELAYESMTLDGMLPLNNQVESPLGAGWVIGGVARYYRGPSGYGTLVSGDGSTRVFLAGGEEFCDGADNDGDGEADEGLTCSYTLYDSTLSTGPCVDDDLNIYLDGTLIYEDTSWGAGCLPTVEFEASPGQTLTFEAYDLGLGCQWLDQIWICENVSGSCVLIDEGTPSACPGSGTGYFYTSSQVIPGDFGTLVDESASFVSPPGDHSTLVRNDDDTYTRTLEDGTTQEFDADGYQTALVEPNGQTTAYTYDSDGRLTAVTDPAGLVTSLTYGTDGKLGTVTDPAGRVSTFDIDGDGNLVAITDPEGNRSTFTYDTALSDHLLTSATSPRGHTATYHYDDHGHIDQVTAPTGEERTYHPALVGGLVDDGTSSEDAPTSPSSTLTDTFVDGEGNTWTYETDARGLVTSLLDPLGRTTTYERNEDGDPTTTSRASGAVDTYSWDQMGNLVEASLAIDSATWATTTVEYDATWNKPTWVLDPEGYEVELSYDAATGELVALTALDPVYGDETTSFAYDSDGRLIEIVAAADSLALTTTLTWYAPGDPACPGGNLESVTDPLGGLVTVDSCDAAGNPTGVTDENGVTIAYTWDDVGQLTLVARAEGTAAESIVDLTWDAAGNLASVTDGNGHTTTYGYDAANRLIAKTTPDDTSYYEWDDDDALIYAEDGDSALEFDRDWSGRATWTRQTWTGYGSEELSWAYDLRGALAALTAPMGSASYDRDALGRLRALVSSLSGTTAWSYDAAGRLVAQDSADADLHTTWTWDDGGRLTSLWTTQHGATVWGVDLAPLTAAGDIAGASFYDGTTRQYGYDALRQLTSVQEPYGGAVTESYSYDANGNRTASHRSTSYTHDAADRLLEDDDHLYDYDDAGRRTLRTEKTTGATTAYLWDAEDHLVLATVTDGSGTITAERSFAYDPLGRRIAQTDTLTGATTWYFYDGLNIVAYDDGSGLVGVVQGPGIDHPIAMSDGASTLWYVSDWLGSVRALVDSAGGVNQTYDYDSFGNQTASTSLWQPFTYTGREWEEGVGLYYNRARWYDPSPAIFLSSDPVLYVSVPSKYSYAVNSPLLWTDALGLWPNRYDRTRRSSHGAAPQPRRKHPPAPVHPPRSTHRPPAGPWSGAPYPEPEEDEDLRRAKDAVEALREQLSKWNPDCEGDLLDRPNGDMEPDPQRFEPVFVGSEDWPGWVPKPEVPAPAPGPSPTPGR